MKLQILIISLFLVAGIFEGAQDGMAWNEFSNAKSSAIAGDFFHSCDFKPAVPAGSPAKNTDPSGTETSSDCCSGPSDYDPVTAARPLACKIQLLVINSYSPSERLALPDPSYPVNKPPQNKSV